ncbi:UDP-N-acetylmuramoyl-L-alanine--D-glutamate ligase [Pleionea sediminis]|uniref:UDP-N-acetylmuramoyl-L-alanine--D-glutamate ligase n=1 Tax=Pleionea sediminis TaxID=2569479 RepID=UPI0011847A2B|nr:UDP-N-acetylmuramoyl-L-alanine--D-glutamate ligase [Pleionea sediminis]
MKTTNAKIFNVAVLGLGMTGASCVRYGLRKGWKVSVFDSREDASYHSLFAEFDERVEIHRGEFESSRFENFDLLVASPGVDLSHPQLAKAIKDYELEVVGDIELFARECKTPIIAVTGSNGKSTVCDCLGWLLSKLNKRCIVAGNIGHPVLDLLDDNDVEIFVLELSSFQLETVKSLNAEVVCVLNISEDHLDRHKTLENYANIKRKLYQFSDSAAVNIDDSLTHDLSMPGNQLSFGASDTADFKVSQSNNGFIIERFGATLVNESDVQLKGFHNGLNIAACLAILELYGLTIDSSVIQALSDYSGLEHRCQIVASNDGVLWVNDSKATNVGASLSAINSFAKSAKNLYLIAGGDAKGADLSELGQYIESYVVRCYVFGKDADKILSTVSGDLCIKVSNLNTAVNQVKQVVKTGDCVLFSPACASLDMYENYIQRGEHFMQLVKEAV